MKTWKAKYNDLVKQRDYRAIGLQEQLKIANKRITDLCSADSKANRLISLEDGRSYVRIKLLEMLANLEVNGE